jgi:UDP-GlcNAc:undecaprenyl-phosphate GlcNAc-1-phosphate transferase
MGGRLLVTGILTFAAAAGLTPVAAALARRLGLLDHPNASRAHVEPTPFLGGAAILAAIFGGMLIARTAVEPEFGRQLLVILLGAAVMGIVGLVDDWRPRAPRWRILLEFAAAAAVTASGVQLRVTPWAWTNVAITVVWIVGITNAVNLLDNMDGLASGAVAIASAGTAYLAVESGQKLVSVMAVAVGAAALGFLVHNRPPARIFMGDAGALSLGFLLAVTVAKLDLVTSPGPVRLTVVLMLCGVGVLDTALVVASRLSRKLSPFVGGTDHSSHRLVRSGLTPGRAVLALHLMSGWFVATAILIHGSRASFAVTAAVVSGIVVVASLWSLFRLPADGPLERERNLSRT